MQFAVGLLEPPARQLAADHCVEDLSTAVRRKVLDLGEVGRPVPKDSAQLGVRRAERLGPGSRDRPWPEPVKQVVDCVGSILEVVGVGDFDRFY